MSRVWFSLAELAQRSLPGFPTTPRGLAMVAERERWATARNVRGEPLSRPRQGRGGGLEFHIEVLPLAARARLMTTDQKLDAVAALLADVRDILDSIHPEARS